MQRVVGSTGCANENNALTDCLKKHKKDWRHCAVLLSLYRNKVWIYPNASRKINTPEIRSYFEGCLYLYYFTLSLLLLIWKIINRAAASFNFIRLVPSPGKILLLFAGIAVAVNLASLYHSVSSGAVAVLRKWGLVRISPRRIKRRVSAVNAQWFFYLYNPILIVPRAFDPGFFAASWLNYPR